jgi:hypothetical protein
MSQWESLVIRALSVRPMTTREICQHYGVAPRRNFRVVEATCRELRIRGELERHQSAQTGVHRWERIATYIGAPTCAA